MKKRKIFNLILFWIVSTLALLLIIEMPLRFTGRPKGLFNSEYPKNATIEMAWGFIPYTIETNSLGLRGGDLQPEKTGGVTRIVALGDSVTEGFFVDNSDTFPYLLESELNKEAIQAEVLNAGKGNISIAQEHAVLRQIMPLKPDIVILTFVTNDISDMRKRTFKDNFAKWLFTSTAAGETVLDWILTQKYESYRAAEREATSQNHTGDRYQIEGGDDYLTNVEIFNERFAKTDGIVLNTPMSTETMELINEYITELKKLNTFTESNNARLLLVYYPSYSQIYDENTSMEIRDILQEASEELSIPFLDLTAVFRQAGTSEVLHLAPLDFHLNPTGNRVMAQAISEFLTSQILPDMNQ